MVQLTEIRNKLMPFKNYFALQIKYNELDDELDALDNKLDEAYEHGNLASGKIDILEVQYDKVQLKQAHLSVLINSELKLMKENLPIIEDLIKQMEDERKG